MTTRLDRIEAVVEANAKAIQANRQANQQSLTEMQQAIAETQRQYRGMVQAVAAMVDAHREFMQRPTDRLDRIEKIVESNAKSIQSLSD
ncbi:hypothetical protein [Acaryochloris sp. IP29b_bin.148]|uniref:hypothetical protein n=1 Tax=Acaryochloris sp. IP29b_bin.148 TaxID=2969218 RepID=UPI002617A235|nr:hypothetical protein [Acaryochloris sp. IP29b_bin.148]